jgi:hypothetical protein
MIAFDAFSVHVLCCFIHKKILCFLLILMQLGEDAQLSKPEGE